MPSRRSPASGRRRPRARVCGGGTSCRTARGRRPSTAPARPAHVPFSVHGPAGLPERLEVWLVHTDGTRQLAATLALDLSRASAPISTSLFQRPAAVAAGTLPDTWWLSYPRAVDVGLGVDIDIGADAAVSRRARRRSGIGDDRRRAISSTRTTAAGGMAVLAPGTPTNTVAGEPTTDFGDRAESVFPLLHADPPRSMSTRGRARRAHRPGRRPPRCRCSAAISTTTAPARWPCRGCGRCCGDASLRDVIGAGAHEIDVARWAIRTSRRRRAASRHSGSASSPTACCRPPLRGLGRRAGRRARAGSRARIRDWALPWRAGRRRGRPSGATAGARRRHPRAARRARACTRRAATGACAPIADLLSICRRCAPCSGCRRSTPTGTATPRGPCATLPYPHRADRAAHRERHRFPARRVTRRRTPSCCESCPRWHPEPLYFARAKARVWSAI